MKKQLFYLLRLGLALGGMIFSVYVSINYLTQFESMVRADTPPPRDSQSNLIKNIQIDEVVAEGFTRPVQVTHAGDGSGRLFVVEQGGKIKIIQDGQVLMRPFLDIQETVNDGGHEQGLLGLTFHPHYTQTGYFYVNYTDAAEFSGKIRRLTAEDVSTATFATNVIYDVVFESTWRAETHPNNFPAGAHLSGLVGAVHRDTVTFWQGGELASAGIESMAETGSKFPLLNEVDQAITQGHALGRLSGGGIGSSPGSVKLSSFALNHNFPLVTLVSMIAPSPDWFVGVSGLSLVDEQGAWIPEMSVQLYPYDSGTDSGVNYTSSNADTNPPEPIRRISGEAPFSEAPIGTFTLTLQEVLPNKAPNAPIIRPRKMVQKLSQPR